MLTPTPGNEPFVSLRSLRFRNPSVLASACRCLFVIALKEDRDLHKFS